MGDAARRTMALLVLATISAACGGPSSSPTPVPQPSPSGLTSAMPSELASSEPVPSSGGQAAACTGAQLAARITAWDEGTGHRFAHIEVTNTGAACSMPTLDRPQLIDGHGAVLLDGTEPGTSDQLAMPPGSVVAANVDASNYCGPAPAPPVSVAFVLPGGADRFVAAPLSPTDTAGLPPCFGSPGDPGVITMTGWTS
jgi:hypothetical protein